ncbi:MAG: PfkB family carbohydrate kinase [Terracidiphilus sp.]|nr:PfkB family carbohydrate kinase [Terracidiphilus sp.]
MSEGSAVRGLFVGLATIDLVYDVEEFPAANTKIEAKSQQVYVGGPATNAAIAFARLGGEATLVAAVGRHALAGVVRAELDRYGVRLVDLKQEFEGVPAISTVAVDHKGRRTVVSANAARIGASVAEPDVELCAWARVVEVDGHQMQACQRWAAAARAQGAHVVMDGGSWKRGTEELLRHVDTAICSADFRPPECAHEDETIAFLAARGVGQIAITHGDEPVRWARGAEAGLIETPRVEAVDTMGAGDIFHGAFCAAWARGIDFREALAEAARVASHSCRFHGTREWMVAGSRG